MLIYALARHERALDALDALLIKALGDEAGAFGSELDALVMRAYRGRMNVNTFISLMNILVERYIRTSYIEGLVEGDIAEEEMDREDKRIIRDMVSAQEAYIAGFAYAVMDAKHEEELRPLIDNRVVYWARSIAGASKAGLDSALKNEVVEWQLGATEEHCEGTGSCTWLNGQRHRRSWFASRGYNEGVPGASMPCGGYNCDCSKVPTRELR